jgi:hypothetical protein
MLAASAINLPPGIQRFELCLGLFPPLCRHAASDDAGRILQTLIADATARLNMDELGDPSNDLSFRLLTTLEASRETVSVWGSLANCDDPG